VENILEARKGGKFTDIYDFISRINLKICNKRAIEGLALAGAFDNLETPFMREQYVADVDKNMNFIDRLIKYGNDLQADSFQAQNSIFGEDQTFDIEKPKPPQVEPWSIKEKLEKEKEVIGFYISAHPLDKFKPQLEYGCNFKMTDMVRAADLQNKTLKCGGMVTKVREGSQKNGQPFMFITIDDYHGSSEISLFGQDYIDFGKYGKVGLNLLITGSFKPRWPGSAELHFKPQQIQRLEDVRSNMLSRLSLSLPLDRLQAEDIGQLTQTIKKNEGSTDVYINVENSKTHSKVFLHSREYKVDVNKELIDLLTSKDIVFSIN
jgi:DNA polymerase-3 subunit alpha